MLNNISWASYAYATGIIIGIYYLFIISIYFRDEVQNLFVLQKNPVLQPVEKSIYFSQNTTVEGGEQLAENTADSEMQELLLSLQSLIKKAGALKYPKEELLLSLQLKLQHYPALKASRLTYSINIFIKQECQNNCSIHLADDEVKVLWGIEVDGVS